jgi:membrane protease YdiL (CAAX protease family)
VTSDSFEPGNGEVPSPPENTPSQPPARPGLTTFTIEGRAAPALFVVGWLASILGVGGLAIGYASPRSLPASVLVLLGLAALSIGLISAAGSQAVERRASSQPYAGPSPYLLVVASISVSTLIASLVGLVATVLGVDRGSLLVTILVLAVIQATYVLLIRLLVVDTGALSWADIGFRPRGMSAVREFATGVSFAIPVLLLTLIVASVAYVLLPVTPESPLPPTGSFPGLLLKLLAAAVLVPIGEETMFRGVATTAWARAFGVQRAVVQGGLFFALVHVLQVTGSNPAEGLALAVVAFVTRVPVALALGWLFLSRRSIWASIGLHSAYNAATLILAELALRAGGS